MTLGPAGRGPRAGAASGAAICWWYAACALAGVPWFVFFDVSLRFYAIGYFWLWVMLLVASHPLSIGHRITGLLLAIFLTFGLWAGVLFYVAAVYGSGES